jgi:hypothetical protein
MPTELVAELHDSHEEAAWLTIDVYLDIQLRRLMSKRNKVVGHASDNRAAIREREGARQNGLFST